jgi:DNA-binding XRE family transcriptional regulator
MRAIDERWKSKLGRFVDQIGTATLAEQLDVSPQAVYHWLRGVAAPSPSTAFEIRELARDSGFRISLEDIYQNFRPRMRIPLARRKQPERKNDDGIPEKNLRADV